MCRRITVHFASLRVRWFDSESSRGSAFPSTAESLFSHQQALREMSWPDWEWGIPLRERASDSLTTQQNIEIELQIYKHVLALMTECNERQSNLTTTTMRATTALPLPPQCTSLATLNLTESWRNNYNNTHWSKEWRRGHSSRWCDMVSLHWCCW